MTIWENRKFWANDWAFGLGVFGIPNYNTDTISTQNSRVAEALEQFLDTHQYTILQKVKLYLALFAVIFDENTIQASK